MTLSPSFKPVINSLLETDLYKFTMLQTILHAYPKNTAEYRFVCRNTTQIPLASLLDEISLQLDHLCTLRFQDDELTYLASCRYFKPDFIQFLRLFQLHRPFIQVTAQGDALHITATGPQVHTMLFEIYVLAIVNEVYFRHLGAVDFEEGKASLERKIETIRNGVLANQAIKHPFEFFDFGLRRRYSAAWHEFVVTRLHEAIPSVFKGTSNVYLAKKLGIVPFGTMGHEYLQTFQAVGVRLRDSQKAALEAWVQEYRGDLGIALTDVIGMDAFLQDFDLFLAKLFDGLRHDSGDPIVWGEKALKHYASLRIDANTKRLSFSDGLTVEKALSLHKHFGDRVQVGFGIGTNLTNDVGVRPLNIVMKLVSCNDTPVAKLSDAAGKTLCDDETFLSYLRNVFNHYPSEE